MNWYKTSQVEKIVSFDFDDTIFKIEWDHAENDFKRDEDGKLFGAINTEIENIMRQHANNGWKVIIVTSRQDSLKSEVEEFVQHYNLPISEIHCTNGEDKVHTLKSLNVLKHFDDDKHEIDAISAESTIAGILI